ncbi:MAG: hypothetical protein KDE19_13090 [Caldilineaceae bacterium]|nr:hypothetical protein [Caldilineaceae bacterium]
MRQSTGEKQALRWPGVVFALAANLLLVTLADMAVTQLRLGINASVVVRLVAPLLAGVLTTLYVGYRGGMHALIGGLISIPLLATFVLPGAWAVSLLAGVICTLGGALMEIMGRSGSP